MNNKIIENRQFSKERDLYGQKDIVLRNCLFDGVEGAAPVEILSLTAKSDYPYVFEITQTCFFYIKSNQCSL